VAPKVTTRNEDHRHLPRRISQAFEGVEVKLDRAETDTPRRYKTGMVNSILNRFCIILVVKGHITAKYILTRTSMVHRYVSPHTIRTYVLPISAELTAGTWDFVFRWFLVKLLLFSSTFLRAHRTSGFIHDIRQCSMFSRIYLGQGKRS
jgi:uncharacterized protein (DUF2126 family)